MRVLLLLILAFIPSGDFEQWRTCLRALGIKLTVISVASFACKAVVRQYCISVLNYNLEEKSTPSIGLFNSNTEFPPAAG